MGGSANPVLRGQPTSGTSKNHPIRATKTALSAATLKGVPPPSGRPRRNVAKPEEVNRFVLPIHDRQHVGLTTYDAKDPETAFPPINEIHPPEGSPNVLIILLDDIGF